MNKGDHVLNGVLLSVGAGVLIGVGPSIGVGAAERTLPAAPVDAAAVVLAEVVRFFVPVVLGTLLPDVDTAFGKHRKTLHNGFVLSVLVLYPIAFDNLQFVWIGVLTHYVLDVIGSARGIAFFYPLSTEEFSLPGGVRTSSRWATPMTVLITGIELAAAALVHYYLVPLDFGAAAAGRVLAGSVGVGG